MNEFMDYLKHRIEETKHDLQAASERMQQAMADRDMLGADLQGYERTLAAEMRKRGITLPVGPTAAAPIPPKEPGDGTETNKAEFARRFMQEQAASGVTPTDLFNGFISAGIPIKKPYIYSLVQRLVGQGTIRKKRGRWYPVLESEADTGAGQTGG